MRYGALPGYVVELGSWLASCRVKGDLVRYGAMPGYVVELGKLAGC